MPGITTHVLDTSRGRPAAGVRVRLEHLDDVAREWIDLGTTHTDADGRVVNLPVGPKQPSGQYRLTFDTGAYFQSNGTPCFYPSVTIAFETTDEQHYHVPLLISPFGYSTYRGS